MVIVRGDNILPQCCLVFLFSLCLARFNPDPRRPLLKPCPFFTMCKTVGNKTKIPKVVPTKCNKSLANPALDQARAPRGWKTGPVPATLSVSKPFRDILFNRICVVCARAVAPKGHSTAGFFFFVGFAEQVGGSAYRRHCACAEVLEPVGRMPNSTVPGLFMRS